MRAEDEQIIIQVTDNGPGIPAKDQAHIFDKFYRGSNISSQAGSGLGLAIVKTIVEAHQGRMWVESTVGKGSTFFIILPVLAEPVPIKK
jgi:two-component system NtrC family sensor kinase